MPVLAHRPPLLSRLLPPAGPAIVRVLRGAGGARVAVLPGRYSNTYLVLGPDGVVVVDVGSAADIPRIVEALAWLGRSPGEVRFVMPSHLHFDHVMGIDALARTLGCPVGLGATARRVVDSGHPARMPGWDTAWHLYGGWWMQGLPFPPVEDWRHGLDFGTTWGRNRFTAPLAPALRDGEPLPGLPGWTVLETPGHSDDAVALWNERAGFLITGDTVRNYHGGEWNPVETDAEAYARTRDRLTALPVRAVFPGHGPVVEGDGCMAGLRLLPGWVP